MTPPRTCKAVLPRPSCITAANDTQNQDFTADIELPISDTETESSYTPQPEDTKCSSLQDHITHLPRPPCSPRPTRQHLWPCFNKSQQLMNTTYIKETKPLHNPVPKHTKSIKTDLQKPSTSTPTKTQTTMKQPTVPAPWTSTASTYPQHTRKTPLLSTPPASSRQFYNRNHYKQHIPGPSPSRYNTYSTCSGPATMNNYRYYLQPHIPGPHTASPLYLHQGFFTRPYQQIPGHLTLQVPYIFTRPYPQIPGHLTPQVYYLPVILPHLYNTTPHEVRRQKTQVI